jgi:hypothetical protein
MYKRFTDKPSPLFPGDLIILDFQQRLRTSVHLSRWGLASLASVSNPNYERITNGCPRIALVIDGPWMVKCNNNVENACKFTIIINGQVDSLAIYYRRSAKVPFSFPQNGITRLTSSS